MRERTRTWVGPEGVPNLRLRTARGGKKGMRKLHYDPFDGPPLRGSILHLLGEKESEVRSENDSEEEETYLYLETTMMPSAMMRSTVMDSDSLSTVDS